MTSTAKALLTVVLFTCTFVPLRLHADPVRVTGGNVQVAPMILSARILFTGDDFLVSTGTTGFYAELAEGVFPIGSSITLGGLWWPTDLRHGQAIVDGVHYPEVAFGESSSGGTFVTDRVTLTGDGLLVMTVPFTFTGFVAGLPSTAFATGGDPLFTAELIGSGVVRAAFLMRPDEGWVGSVTLPGTDYNMQYIFTDPAPIPEPGTLLLVGGAGLALAARRRLRRTARGTPAD